MNFHGSLWYFFEDCLFRLKMSFKILKKGIYSSFRGNGTVSERHLGINPDGVMDKFSFNLLNLLLKNNQSEQVFEMFYPADTILFEKNAFIMLGGADFSPDLDGKPIALWKAYRVGIGSILKFGNKISGNCSYLAIKGGFENPFVGKISFPNFSTHNHLLKFYFTQAKSITLRIILGKEFDKLNDFSKKLMFDNEFKIDINSNRMATRLYADPIVLEYPLELVSRAVDFGTIQLLPSGQLLILMAGHQTTGGYPVMGNIIETDLPKLAQASPHTMVRFEAVSLELAEQISLEFRKEWNKISRSIDYFYKIDEN